MFLSVWIAGLVFAPGASRADEPVLRIAKQGSMEAGGRTIDCATNDGGDPNSTRWPAGHVVVDNVYATYQYPADRRYPYPILLNSGGGHTARFYDTTPDGREGWLTLFLREGFPVARLVLPPVADGHVQVIEADDSPVVAALRDPTTELLLV